MQAWFKTILDCIFCSNSALNSEGLAALATHFSNMTGKKGAGKVKGEGKGGKGAKGTKGTKGTKGAKGKVAIAEIELLGYAKGIAAKGIGKDAAKGKGKGTVKGAVKGATKAFFAKGSGAKGVGKGWGKGKGKGLGKGAGKGGKGVEKGAGKGVGKGAGKSKAKGKKPFFLTEPTKRRLPRIAAAFANHNKWAGRNFERFLMCFAPVLESQQVVLPPFRTSWFNGEFSSGLGTIISDCPPPGNTFPAGNPLGGCVVWKETPSMAQFCEPSAQIRYATGVQEALWDEGLQNAGTVPRVAGVSGSDQGLFRTTACLAVCGGVADEVRYLHLRPDTGGTTWQKGRLVRNWGTRTGREEA